MAGYREERLLEELTACGVPEDLPEMVFREKAPAGAAVLERIKERTLKRIQGQVPVEAGPGLPGAAAREPEGPVDGEVAGWPRGRKNIPTGKVEGFRPSWSRRLKMAAAAAVLAAVVATGWMGPARVWAGLQKALSLVPGFGLFEREGEYTLLALERVRVNHGGGYIQVSGILAQPGGTFLSLYAYRVPGLNDMDQEKRPPVPGDAQTSFEYKKRQVMGIYLVDQAGREYRMGEKGVFGWAESTREAHLSLQLPPLDPDTRQVTLVVPLETGAEVRLTVPLVSLAEAGEWGEAAHTVTAGGVTISAAAHFSEDTRISLFILPGSGRGIDSIGRYFGGGISASRPAVLRGEGGQEYDFLRQGQSGWQPFYYELYYEKAAGGGEEVTYSIPVLLLAEEARARVKVPVVRDGGIWELNQALTLGRFELTLVRGEVVSYPHGDNLRVYVDLGPAGEETLESFRLENQSWSWKACEETGRMEYFEVGLKGNSRHMEFTLTRPVYSVAGPWEFTFTAE